MRGTRASRTRYRSCPILRWPSSTGSCRGSRSRAACSALVEDPKTPLLERVKFAGIMGMLHDEFFMKRMGGG